MRKHKRLWVGIAATTFALAFLVGTTSGQCQEEYFFYACDAICDKPLIFWQCRDGEEGRCCVEWFESDACGETVNEECPGCDGGGPCGF